MVRRVGVKKVPGSWDGHSFTFVPQTCTTPPSMKTPQTVIRAALFIADVLSSVNLTPYLKKWDIKDKQYGKRLIEKLRTNHGLQPSPRQGRPRVYTEEQLAAGQDALTHPSRAYHSKAALVQELKEGGQLPAETKQRGYVPALKRHLQEQGLQLGYGTRSKQQPLTRRDEKERLSFCQRVVHILTPANLKKWWFGDEKPHSEGGKARCELPAAGSCIACSSVCGPGQCGNHAGS